jgi:halimadienyl-diphosphate synthase
MVYDALTMFGRSVDIEGLLSFQGPTHFYCYRIEANASISTNVHVLSALRQAGLTKNDPTVTTVRNYLRSSRLENSYWNDKWHISPFYTTSHAVIAAAGYDPELSDPAADWLLANQDKQGGWGFYLPTAEETAYALQALAIWKKHGGNVPAEIIQKGRNWLIEHTNDTQPFLWIGKSLYMPTLVIETAIQSALAITEQV